MLIVALVIFVVAGFIFWAGVGWGAAVTNANRDDDVMLAREYERKRLEQEWARVRKAARQVMRQSPAANRYGFSPIRSMPTRTTTRTGPSRTAI